RLPGPRVAVGLGAAAEVMAMDPALESAALGDTGDLHAVARGEDRHRHAVARLRGGGLARVGEREALEHAGRRLETRLLGMARERLGRPRRLFALEAELHLGPRYLDHGARAGFDHGDGHVRAFRVEDAGHAELSTDQSCHVSIRP